MLHPPKERNLHQTVIFRNDDVSFDTNLADFKMFCNTFHEFGFIQTHGIVLFGRCNNTVYYNGEGWIFDEITPEEYHNYDKCVKVSKEYIGENKELIEYLNSIPDNIALHGLYHSDYSKMSYEQQENDILEGLNKLKELFPNKTIDTFIAPFNSVNQYTYEICQKLGLRVSALEGEHLEDRIENDKGPIYAGELYRYHHHRFYDDSTFNYYNLSINKLANYLKKYSYTFNYRTGKIFPSVGMLRSFYSQWKCCYITENTENEVLKYVEYDRAIIQIGIGSGELLLKLWEDGYEKLFGIAQAEDKANKFCQLCHLTKARIEILDKRTHGLPDNVKAGAVICYVEKLSGIYDVFDYASRILDTIGYVFIETANENRDEIIDTAIRFHAMLISIKRYSNGNKKLYIFRRKRPAICLLCDRREWAFDFSAQEIKRHLLDEYDIDIKYVVDGEKKDVITYDAFQVFFWGEDDYEKNGKNRIIKQVASHRWQYDAPYGPMDVKDFINKYLKDASTVICPSKILYDLLSPYIENIFLCGEGYSPELFFYKEKRNGALSVCSVGNFKDSVKGLNDILLPSCEGYELHLAQHIKHDKLSDFYNKHDIYIVSSRHESNPLPLMESMACGCFPISTKIGIAPELIRHKDNGYIVEERRVECFQEALLWCKNNLDFIRQKAMDISNEMYNKRRWELMAEGYRKMFRDHIKRTR